MTERLSAFEERSPARPPTALSESGHSDAVEIPARLGNLPPLSAIANRVLASTAQPSINFKQLAAVMECDPAFAADALLIANSALFGLPSRIQGLRHALSVLGVDRIKALAVTVALRGFMGKSTPLLHQCWRHSAACAMIARLISPIFGITFDNAYTLGLLHDVGRLGLLKSYPAEYSPVLADSFESVEHVLRAERALLRVEHGVAGAWLVNKWSFPSTFAQTCEQHHAPLSAQDPELLQVVKVSCRLADAAGFSSFRYTNPPAYEDVIQSLPSHLSAQGFPTAEDLSTTIEAQLKTFG